MSQRLYGKPWWSLFAKVATPAIFLLAAFLSGSHSSQAESAERILPFPSSYSVGSLMAIERAPQSFGTCKGRLLAEARGVVKLPPGKLIQFAPNGTFFQHPECLLKLPRDAFDFVQVRFLSMADEEDDLCDRAIPFLARISSLKGLDLDKSDASDASLSRLGAMPQLLTLTVCEARVTGSCLPALSGCKKLTAFRLSNVAVNTESLRALKDFPHLQRLALVRVELSLRGVEHISKCTELQMLDINYNHRIDDKAVPFLARLHKLKALGISGSSVSLPALEQLAALHLQSISLPKSFSSYSPKEQQRIKKAFPLVSFGSSKAPTVDSFTNTMFAPITR